tara:strand:- start:373 stop:504 length:132 start_codon:yes stop_codon:yes gene_type:complete
MSDLEAEIIRLRDLLARIRDAVTHEPCNMRSRAAVLAILDETT